MSSMFFEPTANGYAGRVRLFGIDEAIVLIALDPGDAENVPDYRVHLDDPDGPDIGGGWKRVGERAGDYIALEIDSPLFGAPFRPVLFQAERDGRALRLSWKRPRPRDDRAPERMSPRRSSSRRRTVALVWLACLAGVPATILAAPAQAQTAPPYDANAVARPVADAAQRWAIPQPWIWAVMGVESAGDPGAVSAKGAIGLMQIMPATWAALRTRYALGPDPYDVRANIMAGAAYLRAMLDRYGDPVAMLAAYNAGPGRYDEYLRGRPLPAETRAYVARLAPVIGAASPPQAHPGVAPDPLAWTRSALFAGRGAMPTGRAAGAAQPADNSRPKREAEGRSAVALVAATPQSPGLFVPLSRRSTQ